MSLHLKSATKQLKKRMLALSAQVEENVCRAVLAVERRDSQLAQDVFIKDQAIDTMEVQIEEECLKVLALFQPVATDLRFIVSMLKINQDLERIGDIAVNIAERAVVLATKHTDTSSAPFDPAAAMTRRLLKASIDALIEMDATAAERVCEEQAAIAARFHELRGGIHELLRADPSEMELRLNCLGVVRHLERIAELAREVAEYVIFLVRGAIVRHRHVRPRNVAIEIQPPTALHV